MISTSNISHPRLVAKLRHALGEHICSALDDPAVVEIMLNPDGRLFIERLGQPIAEAGKLPRAAGETIIGVIAHAIGSEANEARPIVSGELPIGGHRFEGLLPPLVAGPSFAIRKRASQLIPLADYVSSGMMTAAQMAVILSALTNRRNILVAGGTGSGKTTLTNAILAAITECAPHDRFVILEDTCEIQCQAANAVSLRTSDTIDLARLLKATMRLRPDRIIVGEVRDGAALTLLKAWNTGHPGGIATIHANSASAVLQRLEQLTAEVSRQSMAAVIADAVDLVIFIERGPNGRLQCDLLHVCGFAAGKYEIKPAIEDARHAA